MAFILHIESATTNCSVALSKNGEVISLKEINSQQFSHAENLHDFIGQVAHESGLHLNQLNAVSISKGPGSYTGLRIGVSAAKGLAFGLNIPLISVNTLAVLAQQIKTKKGIIIPILDARRMEAYIQLFSAKHEPIGSIEAKILTADSFSTELEQGEVHFVGSAVEKFKPICNHPNARFYSDLLPSAKEQAELAYQKFIQNKVEDTAYFEPYYLKEFVAGKPKPTIT